MQLIDDIEYTRKARYSVLSWVIILMLMDYSLWKPQIRDLKKFLERILWKSSIIYTHSVTLESANESKTPPKGSSIFKFSLSQIQKEFMEKTADLTGLCVLAKSMGIFLFHDGILIFLPNFSSSAAETENKRVRLPWNIFDAIGLRAATFQFQFGYIFTLSPTESKSFRDTNVTWPFD